MVPHARIVEKDLCGTLADENRHRIERVLRCRVGDKFVITDGEGHETTAELGENGTYSASEWQTPGREPEADVTLFAAVSKGERLEWLIEKAVEMGVRHIVPLMTERCIVTEPGRSKIERWQKVAVTAMIQCGGCILPEVSQPVKIKNLEKPDSDTVAILLHEERLSVSLDKLPADKSKSKIWLASGPEGGFSDAEADEFIKSGWQAVWLGKRLFKTDTAPTVALANILLPQWY